MRPRHLPGLCSNVRTGQGCRAPLQQHAAEATTAQADSHGPVQDRWLGRFPPGKAILLYDKNSVASTGQAVSSAWGRQAFLPASMGMFCAKILEDSGGQQPQLAIIADWNASAESLLLMYACCCCSPEATKVQSL